MGGGGGEVCEVAKRAFLKRVYYNLEYSYGVHAISTLFINGWQISK
jgi:hypothetical protein